ncbi:hypothetical protein PHLCEN_2v240 [Hermanssonia centrifuga]|uniref:Peptidase C14 caspase domain-containing protein n=1 Tax=Hermanssonia centrifuga TaxID=98765 RepID=A0A2R6S6N9_9APHY|nr:hypothetical protein PHLCEN_2v240 [Hermanssonia centrifuga]
MADPRAFEEFTMAMSRLDTFPHNPHLQQLQILHSVDEFPHSKGFALIIGIDNYQDPGINNLSGAVADADEFEKYLTDVCQFDICSLRDQDATLERIIEGIKEMTYDNRIQIGDPILIFFAGHGSSSQSLLPYDCVQLEGETTVRGISRPLLHASLVELEEAKGNNITVILDCCYSGSAMPTGRQDSSSIATDINSRASGSLPCLGHRSNKVWDNHNSSYVLLTACGRYESAMEKNGRGVYTEELLKVLSSAPVHTLTYVALNGRLKLQGNIDFKNLLDVTVITVPFFSGFGLSQAAASVYHQHFKPSISKKSHA